MNMVSRVRINDDMSMFCIDDLDVPPLEDIPMTKDVSKPIVKFVQVPSTAGCQR
jgi:hypothetical protein